MRLARWAIVALAFAQMLVFALGTPTGNVAPDEDYHHNLIGHVEAQRNPDFWAPRDSRNTYGLGPVSRYPHLYHQIFGVVLALKPEAVTSYLWLRLWNMALALATLVLAMRLGAREGGGDPRASLAVGLFLSSTLMWLFLGGSVTYDNLTNLIAACAGFLLLAHVREPSLPRFAAIFALSAAGMLVKIVFLPLGAIFVCAAAAPLLRHRKAIGIPSTRTERIAMGLSFTLVLVFLGAAGMKYGTNVFRYGGITPSCERVIPEAACLSRYEQYRDRTKREKENATQERLSLPVFSFKYFSEVSKRSDDILGYVYVPVHSRPWRTALLFAAIFGGAFFAWRNGWRPARDTPWLTALAVSLLYACAVGGENYRTHLNEGDFGISIHPRYFYPIYALLGVVVFTPMFRVATSSRARWAFLAAIAASQLLRGPIDAGSAIREKIVTCLPGGTAPAKACP